MFSVEAQSISSWNDLAPRGFYVRVLAIYRLQPVQVVHKIFIFMAAQYALARREMSALKSEVRLAKLVWYRRRKNEGRVWYSGYRMQLCAALAGQKNESILNLGWDGERVPKEHLVAFYDRVDRIYVRTAHLG